MVYSDTQYSQIIRIFKYSIRLHLVIRCVPDAVGYEFNKLAQFLYGNPVVNVMVCQKKSFG